MSDDRHDEIAAQLFASLRRTGINFIFVWLLAVVGVIAVTFHPALWIVWATTGILVVLLVVVCVPNIGRIVALSKLHGGMDIALRRNVVLADVGAFATAYSIIALWWPLPFAVAGVLAGSVAAFVNSQQGE